MESVEAIQLGVTALENSRFKFTRAESAAMSVEAFANAKEYRDLIAEIDTAIDALNEAMKP